MKKVLLLLLAIASTVTSQATAEKHSDVTGLSIGIGIGRLQTTANIHSHYHEINLFAGSLTPFGHEEFGSFSLGKPGLTKTTLNGHFCYLHRIKNTHLHRFSIGLMGAYDIGAQASTGILSTSGIILVDPSFTDYFERFEKPESFGSEISLVQKKHWSLGPTVAFHWRDQMDLFTRLSVHRLTTQTTQRGIVGTDELYDNTIVTSSNPSFLGLGLGVGAMLGKKSGWFVQPEVEFIRYFSKNISVPNITDNSIINTLELTIIQKHQHKLSGCLGRLNVGYRF